MAIVWTDELVKAELVKAFQAAPCAGIWSPRKSAFLLGISADRAAQWDFIAFSYLALGQDATAEDRERRLMLLTWARVTALHAIGAQDASMREICREMGWDWTRFNRTHEQAAWKLASHLNTAEATIRAACAALTGQPPKPAAAAASQ